MQAAEQTSSPTVPGIDWTNGTRHGMETGNDLSGRKTPGGHCRAAADSLGVKDRCVVTWDDEDSLPGNIQVVPIWKFLLDRATE